MNTLLVSRGALPRPLRAKLQIRRVGVRSTEDDHHAFTWWAPRALAVLPVAELADETTTSVARAFRIDRAGGIQALARIPAPEDDRFSRSLVVGDKLLLVGYEHLFATPVAAPGAGTLTRLGG